MKLRTVINGMTLAALIMGVSTDAYSDEVENDALISALNAEIGKIDEQDDDGKMTKKKTPDSEGESDDVVKAKTVGKRQGQMGAAPVSGSNGRTMRPRPDLKNSKVITVLARGCGETASDARLDAFRKAVERAVGVWVDAESQMENSQLLKNRVNTISNADIEKYETVREGRLKSGAYVIKIKALIKKKAIAPKFADIFPDAFANVGEASATIHVQKVTKAKRTSDAASLMSAEMEGLDRMLNWVRLSVAKGKGLVQVTKIKNYRNSDIDVAEVPGRGLYAVRYAMTVDTKAYFEGFVPHFKEVLSKMQEGESAEGESLEVKSAIESDNLNLWKAGISEDAEGRKLVMSRLGGGPMSLPSPFCKGQTVADCLYFVDPVVLSGFSGLDTDNLQRRAMPLGNVRSAFMFDYSKGLAKINNAPTYNIWLLDRMNKGRTSVRHSAYKVPAEAIRAYWKSLYGNLDSPYVIGNVNRDIPRSLALRNRMKVEVTLFDAEGEEIASKDDQVPACLLTWGGGCFNTIGATEAWVSMNVFESFFVRPMFYSHGERIYAAEVQRDVYIPLTDAQLERVNSVKVRFVRRKYNR